MRRTAATKKGGMTACLLLECRVLKDQSSPEEATRSVGDCAARTLAGVCRDWWERADGGAGVQRLAEEANGGWLKRRTEFAPEG